MELNFEEDISTLSKTELRDRRDKLFRDKRFVQHKVIFWGGTI